MAAEWSAPLYPKGQHMWPNDLPGLMQFTGPDEDAEFLALQLDSEAQRAEKAETLRLEGRLAEAWQAYQSQSGGQPRPPSKAGTPGWEPSAPMSHGRLAGSWHSEITAPDLTVSWRMGKPPLIIDGRRSKMISCWLRNRKTVFRVGQEAVRQLVESRPDRLGVSFRLATRFRKSWCVEK